jgi:hypothetical protein
LLGSLGLIGVHEREKPEVDQVVADPARRKARTCVQRDGCRNAGPAGPFARWPDR